MRKPLTTLALLLLLGCPAATPQPVTPPGPAPDTDACALMCAHIGPSGLKCPEGMDVYDSSTPPLSGKKPGDPNMTCTEFCQQEQTNGVFLNPKCVALVPSCSQIETWRQKDCSKQ